MNMLNPQMRALASFSEEEQEQFNRVDQENLEKLFDEGWGKNNNSTGCLSKAFAYRLKLKEIESGFKRGDVVSDHNNDCYICRVESIIDAHINAFSRMYDDGDFGYKIPMAATVKEMSKATPDQVTQLIKAEEKAGYVWTGEELTEIKPEYRPFTMEEFKPHRDKWFKLKEGGDAFNIYWYNVKGLYFDKRPNTLWSQALKDIEFEDGTPFGIKIS